MMTAVIPNLALTGEIVPHRRGRMTAYIRLLVRAVAGAVHGSSGQGCFG